MTTGDHVYLSTACWHARSDSNPDLHTACRNVCKYCPRPCGCDCHPKAGTQTGRLSPVDQARDVARELLTVMRASYEGVPKELWMRIENDPNLFWLRGEEQPPGEWQSIAGELDL